MSLNIQLQINRLRQYIEEKFNITSVIRRFRLRYRRARTEDPAFASLRRPQ